MAKQVCVPQRNLKVNNHVAISKDVLSSKEWHLRRTVKTAEGYIRSRFKLEITEHQ